MADCLVCFITKWFRWLILRPGSRAGGGAGASNPPTFGKLGDGSIPLISFTNIPIPEDETLTKTWDFQSWVLMDFQPLRTFAAKTSNVQNFFKLLQECDIVERIRKTRKKLGVTTLLLQLDSIENDQIWSFLRHWVSMRHGGENTFRVSKAKKFCTFLVKDECSSNYKSVLAPVKRWNRPLEAFEGQAWPIYSHATEWKTLFLKMF